MSDDNKLTLGQIREGIKTEHHFTLKDFTTEAEREQLSRARAKAKAKAPKFDAASAVSAEILARFGFDAWKAWQNGEISQKQMSSYLAAERGRDLRLLADLETAISVLMTTVARRQRGKPAPKGFKMVQKMVQNHERIMKGLD